MISSKYPNFRNPYELVQHCEWCVDPAASTIPRSGGPYSSRPCRGRRKTDTSHAHGDESDDRKHASFAAFEIFVPFSDMLLWITDVYAGNFFAVFFLGK